LIKCAFPLTIRDSGSAFNNQYLVPLVSVSSCAVIPSSSVPFSAMLSDLTSLFRRLLGVDVGFGVSLLQHVDFKKNTSASAIDTSLFRFWRCETARGFFSGLILGAHQLPVQSRTYSSTSAVFSSSFGIPLDTRRPLAMFSLLSASVVSVSRSLASLIARAN